MSVASAKCSISHFKSTRATASIPAEHLQKWVKALLHARICPKLKWDNASIVAQGPPDLRLER